jgi:hypothetical protein
MADADHDVGIDRLAAGEIVRDLLLCEHRASCAFDPRLNGRIARIDDLFGKVPG